jgi:hypothetical protein
VHAVLITVTINDQSDHRAQLDGLVPQVSGMPGFLAGYWVALSQDRGTAMIVFDSEESAQSLVPVAQSAPPGAVTTQSVEVGEVMAHA